MWSKVPRSPVLQFRNTFGPVSWGAPAYNYACQHLVVWPTRTDENLSPKGTSGRAARIAATWVKCPGQTGKSLIPTA